MKPLLLASLLLALPLQAQNNTPCDAINGVLDKVQNEYVAEGNFNKALKTLNKTIRKAQNSDCPQLQDAINLFSKIEKITSTEAFREYGKKLAKGNAEAQKAIGDCYFNGKKGLPLDIVESTKWYMKAADQGDPGAQYQLAWCYEHAYVGEEQNYDEAGKLYMKAAEQGYALAENQVAHYYQSGLYGERDYEEAVKWFRKAADNDLAEAQKNLGSSAGATAQAGVSKRTLPRVCVGTRLRPSRAMPRHNTTSPNAIRMVLAWRRTSARPSNGTKRRLPSIISFR